MRWLGISHSTPLPQSFENQTHPPIDKNQEDVPHASNSIDVIYDDKAKETLSTRDEASSKGNIFSVVYVIVRSMIIVPRSRS